VKMARIHISEAEAARDFTALMAQVRAGAEVVIEDGALPVALIRSAVPISSAISDCIALAKKHEEETGEAPVLDPDFAADVEEIIRNRKPWNPPAWD
jgi:antitoxin (DNA-binding transcriptional repressor) of toxin-antitoxin stability system